METGEIQFRTAALGGFVKQDVLDYIAQSNQEHTDRAEQLQRRLQECEEERDALRARAEEAERRSVELSAQVQELKSQLADQTGRLSACEEKQSEQETDATGLRAELDRLRARLAEAEPAAQAYEAVKDRTAGIELEAHCRAKGIEEEALARVDKARQELEDWVHKVQHIYDHMRTDVSAAVSRSVHEMDQIRTRMAGLNGELEAHDADLKRMVKACEDTIAPKMPEPLPLEEK